MIHMNNEEAEDKFMHRNIELVDLSFDEVQTVKNNQLLAFTTNDSNASMFIDKKEIHVFLMPFPSVDEFRKCYLKTIK